VQVVFIKTISQKPIGLIVYTDENIQRKYLKYSQFWCYAEQGNVMHPGARLHSSNPNRKRLSEGMRTQAGLKYSDRYMRDMVNELRQENTPPAGLSRSRKEKTGEVTSGSFSPRVGFKLLL